MSIFDIITLFGGLAMFLYGMHLMGDSLREGASGTLKKALEKVTNNSVKAFFLGLLMTAVIQSSTATIVITSGLVGAGLLTLHQSLGIIIGANVGTTVTGQIIRLLDLNTSGSSLLRFFTPSTLAPVALILGIVIIMSSKKKESEVTGNIIIGFGVLFSGLLNMTGAVSVLSDTGLFDSLFSRLTENPFLGYVIGAGVAFVLQSSSATVGILQAFSLSGSLSFGSVYAVIVGIYLGDCVTTAIVCSIGAKPEAKRVGMVNILFNLSETVLVLLVVGITHRLGLLDSFWSTPIRSGGIANTNTVFNMGCAMALFPLLPVYERLSHRIIRDKDGDEPAAKGLGEYANLVAALNPNFFDTPALAFRSCYNAMRVMLKLSVQNLNRAAGLFRGYHEDTFRQINEDEDIIDRLTDSVSRYLVQISTRLSSETHIAIFREYNKVLTEFERIGDHAVNIAEHAKRLHQENLSFSVYALREQEVLMELIGQILTVTDTAFSYRDLRAARHIEPMEEVVDDMIDRLRTNHLDRLRRGVCSVNAGVCFLDILTDLERVSDCCSNVGLSIIVRAGESKVQPHDYIMNLHEGNDQLFNTVYSETHERYFQKLDLAEIVTESSPGK